MSPTFATQTVWQQMQTVLPPEFHIAPGQEAAEEAWQWRGHRVHLDTYRNPEARVKVILFHGVGTNGRQMSKVLGAPLAQRGDETIAIDMPEYGMTEVAPRALVRYDDWVQAGSDLIKAERRKDKRPIVLYGLSAGGMLAYRVAALNRQVQGIVGMTFLDTASKMHLQVNDPAMPKVWLSDKRSAGNAMTLAFLSSYLAYRPAVEPEAIDACPALLTQPAQDRWTPLHLSEPFLLRLRQVPVKTVMLEGAGNYPLEQPGLSQMVDAIDDFYRQHARP